MERRALKVGMQVRVLPAAPGRLHPSYLATVMKVPTENRGRAKVRFTAQRGTALVPIRRLVKP